MANNDDNRKGFITLGTNVANRTASKIFSETFSVKVDTNTLEPFVEFKVMDGKISNYIKVTLEDAILVARAIERGPLEKPAENKRPHEHVVDSLSIDETNDGRKYYTFRTGSGKANKTQKILMSEIPDLIKNLLDALELAKTQVNEFIKSKSKNST